MSHDFSIFGHIFNPLDPDSENRQSIGSFARWILSTKKSPAKVSVQLSQQSYSFQHIRPGPARRYNLEKCRKKLEKSCSDYQSRGNRLPPTPRSTPCTNSATAQQQQHRSAKQEKKVRFEAGQSLYETAHVPHKVKRCPFQYNEKEIRQRANHIRTQSKQASRLRLNQPPVSAPDPLASHTGHDSSNDEQNDNSNTKGFAPRRHPTLHRQDLTQDEFVAIRDTAARIAEHCAVRDERPYPDPSAQETLHRIRSSIWLKKTKNGFEKDPESAPPDEKQDDNGISITDDNCIIQRGFDISPMTSSPVDTVHSRCDSGFDSSQSQTPCQEPHRLHARNRRGARVPVCFRKQEIVHQQKVSHLTALFPGRSTSTGQPDNRRTTRNNVHHAHMQVLTRPLVFFSGSSSSGAVVSDSEDDSDEEHEESHDGKTDSVPSSAEYADGAKDMTSIGHGSVDTPVVMDKPAETIKTSNRLPQRSAPPSPLSSKLPVLSPPQVEQVPPLHAGTPLPQRLSKHPDLPSTVGRQASSRFPPAQQGNIRPQFLRSQQTARVFLAHQQYRRAQKPLPPRARSPCQELAVRFSPPPKYGRESNNYTSALLDKIEKNGGKRLANFSWDHVAPMHGFSSCSAFYVLD
jgi:hypothetical protein